MPTEETMRRRFAALAAAAVATAAIAAGYAYAQTRAPLIGTGVVAIDTNLAYQHGAAAGTGMVLTSSGRILTNNHVIRGATTIRIVVAGTGRSYTATVVGYDVTDDVAVLQATGAASLKTVTLGTSTALKVGQRVKAVGNAGGTGRLVTSKGTITGLGRTIRVSDEAGNTVMLRSLIRTDAELEPGDSGGPLLNGAGKVVGMDVAASATSTFRASGDGYAIPIDRAVSILKQIVAGKASATVHIGGTAFLGISASDGDLFAPAGAAVTAVVPGGAADRAGLVAGDVITAVNSRAVNSSVALTRIVLTYKPGTTVTITYLDSLGTSRRVRATLGSGPPQ